MISFQALNEIYRILKKMGKKRLVIRWKIHLNNTLFSIIISKMVAFSSKFN